MFLTADRQIVKEVNRSRRLEGEPELEYKPNFRIDLAKTKEYKGTRKANKPFHYKNLTSYILAHYEIRVANGIEADDLLGVEQYARLKNGYDQTIICSRDKDLRMLPGNHYSWECGRQSSIGPTLVDGYGWLEKLSAKKVIGYGDAFFYYQMLVGDTVDNIPGLPSYGIVTAYNLFCGGSTVINDSASAYNLVVDEYRKVYEEDWEIHFIEMANLLWMVRELDEQGNPIFYKRPE